MRPVDNDHTMDSLEWEEVRDEVTGERHYIEPNTGELIPATEME